MAEEDMGEEDMGEEDRVLTLAVDMVPTLVVDMVPVVDMVLAVDMVPAAGTSVVEATATRRISCADMDITSGTAAGGTMASVRAGSGQMITLSMCGFVFDGCRFGWLGCPSLGEWNGRYMAARGHHDSRSLSSIGAGFAGQPIESQDG
jgi:hypothetical protein